VLKSIETLGPRFIRGIEPIDRRIVKTCLESYEPAQSRRPAPCRTEESGERMKLKTTWSRRAASKDDGGQA